MPDAPGLLRVAIINDHPVVVRGAHALLADHPARIEVVELDSDMPVAQPVDLALYDAFTMAGVGSPEVQELLDNPLVGGLVLYTWNIQPAIVEGARARGLRAVLSKTLTSEELVLALEQTRSGEFLVCPGAMPASAVETLAVCHGDWPGRTEGLSAREAEVIALITQGLSNQEIAERIHLSINSVKTYIRTAYRTIGVTTRSQALLWGLDHGMKPHRERVRNPG